MYLGAAEVLREDAEDHGHGQGDENGQEDGQAEDDIPCCAERQAELLHQRRASAGLGAGLGGFLADPAEHALESEHVDTGRDQADEPGREHLGRDDRGPLDGHGEERLQGLVLLLHGNGRDDHL